MASPGSQGTRLSALHIAQNLLPASLSFFKLSFCNPIGCLIIEPSQCLAQAWLTHGDQWLFVEMTNAAHCT